jgi:hypothetical protein
MANMKTAARAILNVDAGVIAELGATPTTRIYEPALPVDATLPALSIIRVLEAHYNSLAAGAGGKQLERLQVTTFAKSVLDSEALQEAVIAALDGFSGTSDTIVIKSVSFIPETRFDDFEPTTEIIRTPLDFEFYV